MSTDTKTIDTIKSLRREADALANFHRIYSEKYSPNSRCDKKGYGFGEDDRFAAFHVKTHFASWHGYYGSSSCSTILSVYDSKAVESAIVRAMNTHQKEIFATAARLLREEAAALTEKAAAELTALQAMLNDAAASVSEISEPAQ